jgi:hypothetical protein
MCVCHNSVCMILVYMVTQRLCYIEFNCEHIRYVFFIMVEIGNVLYILDPMVIINDDDYSLPD